MIAQSYRPKVLDEIVGHDSVLKEIKKRFANNNFPQVSMFVGMTGTGKTTLAYNISKILQCENKLDNCTPCNNCSSCNDINRESFIQGTFMYNASNLDTESMRSIEDLTQTTSFVSDKKIFILDELQELSNNRKAMKNILKILEKPNPDIYFILLTMDETKIDKAVKNRSVVYKLYPVDYSKIAEYLYNICLKLNIEMTEEMADILFLISENSGGSVRQACAYLERVVEGGLWTKELLEEVLHFVNDKSIVDLCLKIINKDFQLFESQINEEILGRIKYTFVELAKYLCGYNMESWKKKQLEGLIGYKPATLNVVMSVINVLNDIYKFPFLNQEIIDSILLKLFVLEQSQTIVVTQESPKIISNEIKEVVFDSQETPKRRRV